MIYDKYIEDVTKVGRITIIMGLIVSLFPPLIMTFVFGFNPGIGPILAGAISQISVVGAFYFSEPISYYPIVGRAGLYMGFLAGNLLNMRIPAAVASVESSGYKNGTDKGAIMGTIGMGVSIWVGVVFLMTSVILGQTLLSQLPSSVMTIFKLIIPALFGGVFAQFAYKAPKIGFFALAIAFIMIKIVAFIPGKPSYIVTLVSVFATIAFAKRVMHINLENKN